jgi:hypothetical protein
MTVTASSFRADFPEFASTTNYPDAQVDFWIDAAGQLVSEDRWGTLYDFGVELLVAHNLTLGRRDQVAVAGGGVGGASGGVVSSKSVDKVSVSYDTGAATFEGAGDLNTTMYGIRWNRLARMFGAGGLQI